MVVETEDAYVCPWFKVVRKRVRPAGRVAEFDHFSILQQDYVTVLAVTRAGRIPLVRQFRPAVDRYTWELPAGLREPSESPRAAACRELEEEAGLRTVEIVEVCSTFADTGRLSSHFHGFFAIAEEAPVRVAEPGLQLSFCSIEELRARVLSSDFVLQTHIGLLYSATIHPGVRTVLSRAHLSKLFYR